METRLTILLRGLQKFRTQPDCWQDDVDLVQLFEHISECHRMGFVWKEGSLEPRELLDLLRRKQNAREEKATKSVLDIEKKEEAAEEKRKKDGKVEEEVDEAIQVSQRAGSLEWYTKANILWWFHSVRSVALEHRLAQTGESSEVHWLSPERVVISSTTLVSRGKKGPLSKLSMHWGHSLTGTRLPPLWLFRSQRPRLSVRSLLEKISTSKVTLKPPAREDPVLLFDEAQFEKNFVGKVVEGFRHGFPDLGDAPGHRVLWMTDIEPRLLTCEILHTLQDHGIIAVGWLPNPGEVFHISPSWVLQSLEHRIVESTASSQSGDFAKLWSSMETAWEFTRDGRNEASALADVGLHPLSAEALLRSLSGMKRTKVDCFDSSASFTSSPSERTCTLSPQSVHSLPSPQTECSQIESRKEESHGKSSKTLCAANLRVGQTPVTERAYGAGFRKRARHWSLEDQESSRIAVTRALFPGRRQSGIKWTVQVLEDRRVQTLAELDNLRESLELALAKLQKTLPDVLVRAMEKKGDFEMHRSALHSEKRGYAMEKSKKISSLLDNAGKRERPSSQWSQAVNRAAILDSYHEVVGAVDQKIVKSFQDQAHGLSDIVRPFNNTCQELQRHLAQSVALHKRVRALRIYSAKCLDSVDVQLRWCERATRHLFEAVRHLCKLSSLPFLALE